MLKLRNMSESAVDVYSRAVHRVVEAFDCPPDQLDKDQYRAHFAALIDSHSWSTVSLRPARVTGRRDYASAVFAAASASAPA